MKVGDYVRTRDGLDRLVSKIKDDNYDYYWYRFGNGKTMTNPENDFVKKSSPNIIDLIEEHDILKIEEQKGVYTICEVEIFREPYEEYTFLGVRLDNRPIARKLYELNIKSIVTREMFESIEYKVGD